MLTLVADATSPPPVPRALPEPYRVRAVRRSDTDALGRLYLEAYEPGTAAATLEEAVDDIRTSFEGGYGPLWHAASPVATFDGELVGAVLTVRRAPWDDVPRCPFIIETFTSPGHRRIGLARSLLAAVFDEVRASPDDALALRVRADNDPALALYRSLGFRPDERT